MGQKEKGSFETWDKIWATQDGDRKINFTKTKPSSIYQFWQKVYADDLLNLIKGKNYTRFLELGAGRGTTSMYLLDAGYEDVTMVDLAEEGFKTAAYTCQKYNLKKPTMVIANVEDTGLDANSYDCIYNIGLLEHFENPKPTLAESYKLLKPGGLIFMPIVPELPWHNAFLQRLIFSPITLAKLIVKQLIGKGKKEEEGMMRTNYQKKHYADICKELGFKNVKCIPYNPYWKVNPDGNFEQKVTLPAYFWHYNTFKKGKPLSFKTSSAFELCFLLIGEKAND